MNDTRVLTLEEYLITGCRDGGVVTPLVLEYCGWVAKSMYEVCRQTVLQEYRVEIGVVAYGEYLDRISNGSIPLELPFSQYYRFGELPDRYALKLVSIVLGNLLRDVEIARYRWLQAVIQSVMQAIR